MKNLRGLFVSLFVLALLPSKAVLGQEAGLVIESPQSRVVFQRNHQGQAFVPLSGHSSKVGAIVEARFTKVGTKSPDSNWRRVDAVHEDGTFQGRLPVQSGWYELEARVLAKEQPAQTGRVDRVGVGEVFVIVGHSVAHGGKIQLPGAVDERVNTIALSAEGSPEQKEYEKTGEPRFLPPLKGAHFATGVRPAPFGHGTYFWARFGEHVAKSQDVPVLILNAAFGGTSLEHWAKSAKGIPFEHSFVKSRIRMPYINLHNALKRYIAATGVRAILADQGQNDWPELDEKKVFENYRTWVEQARMDLGFDELAIVVNRQTPHPNKSQIRRAQERMIRENPNCFPGPDYDNLSSQDRYDHIHLSEPGAEKGAKMWAEALDEEFFRKAKPFQPGQFVRLAE